MLRLVMRWSIVAVGMVFWLPGNVLAVSSVVIAELQTGGTSDAKQEYITLYNNGDSLATITNWCVVYSSASNASSTTLRCFVPPDSNTDIVLDAHKYLTLATQEFTLQNLGFVPNYSFTAGLSGTGGHLRVMNNATPKLEVDKVGWGNAVSPETQIVGAPSAGKILERILLNEIRQDTGNNFLDFGVDACSNLAGMQKTIPGGYQLDEAHECQLDTCTNIDGLQINLPDGYTVDGTTCHEVVEEAQLIITEVLPNVSGADTGNEYIEIYNPNQRAVNIKNYELQLGPSYTTSYTFLEQMLAPLSFSVFSDLLTGIALPNTSASLRLINPANNIVSEAPAYVDPKDGEAWALISDMWQYTNQPTPAAINLLRSVAAAPVGGGDDEATLQPCPEGKVRNPETNRCRNIESDDTELRPCSAGQTRNEETNRCRSVLGVSSILTPCKEDQERNPETNRCRSLVSTASALTPCKEGEERNPETNRCRKGAGQTSSLATVKDVPAKSSATSSVNMWVIGGLVSAALGYAAYEWRHELMARLSRLKFPSIGSN